MTTRRKLAPPVPPDHVSDEVREVWAEVVAAEPGAARVDAASMEAYCTLVARMREATALIAKDQLVVAGARGPIVHPALAVERQLAEQIQAQGKAMFSRRRDRCPGPMYDATRASIKAAAHLVNRPELAGAIKAVETMAWLIDEAQRDGIEELRKATFNLLPSYIKGCAELQITPASAPVVPTGKGASGGEAGSNVAKFADKAAQRRRLREGTG